jgi:hypothetical protein
VKKATSTIQVNFRSDPRLISAVGLEAIRHGKSLESSICAILAAFLRIPRDTKDDILGKAQDKIMGRKVKAI